MPDKLSLPDVTMVCADCVSAERAIAVLDKCKSLIDFADIQFFHHVNVGYQHQHAIIPQLKSLNDYSWWMMKELHKHVKTSHMLTVQHDGWILNPAVWRDRWLKYDYVGPLFLQEQDVNDATVGSGGFSLRSKKLMEHLSSLMPERDGKTSYDGNDGKDNWAHEDGVICKHFRQPLQGKGFVFAPLLEAAVFAQAGNPHPDYYVERPFGFHGFWVNIDRDTGVVGSWEYRVKEWLDAGKPKP